MHSSHSKIHGDSGLSKTVQLPFVSRSVELISGKVSRTAIDDIPVSARRSTKDGSLPNVQLHVLSAMQVPHVVPAMGSILTFREQHPHLVLLTSKRKTLQLKPCNTEEIMPGLVRIDARS